MNLNRFKNRLFGRTRGRSKKKFDINKYHELNEKFAIKKFVDNQNYILDIGTGYGETSLYLSKKFPKKTIIACEKYIDGNFNLYKKIIRSKINNIRVFPGNVNELLDQNEKQKNFKLIWIFFPDPWPKKRHWKRRLINKNFLKKIYNFLDNNGEIYIVTDSISYSRYIFNVIFENKNLYKFINLTKTYLTLKDYHNIETKYYKKAIISGRNPILFILKKL